MAGRCIGVFLYGYRTGLQIFLCLSFQIYPNQTAPFRGFHSDCGRNFPAVACCRDLVLIVFHHEGYPGMVFFCLRGFGWLSQWVSILGDYRSCRDCRIPCFCLKARLIVAYGLQIRVYRFFVFPKVVRRILFLYGDFPLQNQALFQSDPKS